MRKDRKPASGSDPASDARRRRLQVCAVIAALLCLAVLVGPRSGATEAFLHDIAMPWWAVAAAFAATEAFVLHVQVRRETRTISFSEIPLVLGLFFASPLALVAGRVLASAVVLVLHRRSPPLKVAFNVALVVAETAVAVSTFRAFTSGGAVAEPVTWLAAYVAAFAAGALGSVAVGCVIAVQEGALRGRLILRDAAAQQVPAMGATIALLAVTSLSSSIASAWLLVAFGALLLFSFRAYAALAERHQNLERLFTFSQAVGGAPDIDELMDTVLSEARELLRSERASAAFLVSDGGLVARMRASQDAPMTRSEDPLSSEDRWVIDRVLGSGSSLLMQKGTREAQARAWLATYGMRDAIAVPLNGGDDVAGVLVVSDRLGDVRSFDEGDVRMLETVANHAGIALRNGHLMGRLRHEALHDALTGLPNRARVQHDLSEALDEVRAGRSTGAAVLVLDLDDFTQVNDSLGHQQGDQLLMEVGTRLTSAVGHAGSVARLGNDEFAVLLPATGDESRVVRIGERLLHALRQPIALDGLEVELSASVGIALAPVHASTPEDMLKHADVAMHDAQSSGRSVRVYECGLDAGNARRLTLVSELRSALATGALTVHVQPQARPGTGEVVSVEALARWSHPVLGPISPDEFIAVAERSGLVGQLTTQVLDASLAAAASWRAAGHDLSVAVNLSTRSLQDEDLVDEVDRLLRRHGLPAGTLTLEVTESSVMADPDTAVAVLRQLRGLGVRVSVDDFGTGYSSLSYLQRLPVQELKIDRSFVLSLPARSQNAGIVRAIIDLGRHLGLEVVAEGVEDEPTWALLATMGCHLVQGWHLARPMPIGDLLPWLAARDLDPVPVPVA